jgi:hypothetical protein
VEAALLGQNTPQWLTSREDVIAHLYFAAAEIGAVDVEVGGRTVGGSISFPSPESSTFSFFATRGADETTPAEGAVVRVAYRRGDSEYAFLTEVSEAGAGGRWRLAFPRTIERSERRIVGRHRVLAVGGYRIRVDKGDGTMAALPLVDLSTAGLSFIYEDGTLDLQQGRSFAGSILLPSGTAIPVLVELRNHRPADDRPGQRVAGCRFVGLAAQDHAVLARALADQKA